jgi:hypothetical protein
MANNTGRYHQIGVLYFETRFAPIFHTQKGLSHRRAEGPGVGPKGLCNFFGVNHLCDAQHERVTRNGRTRR